MHASRVIPIALLATVILMASAAAQAHDFLGFSIINRDFSDNIPGNYVPKMKSAESTVRGVIDTNYLWEKRHALSICFLQGSDTLRRDVANAMQRQWPVAQITSGNLTYGSSFSRAPLCTRQNITGADITVSFSAGGGYWSMVGTNSALYAPSMNFDRFMKHRPADFAQIVGHEMGHALGLDHEHQSPNAPPCAWNYDYIKELSGWSPATVHRNFDKLQNEIHNGVPQYVATSYDQKSIMHYQLPAGVFKDGAADPCFIQAGNKVPSETDLQAIKLAYSEYAGVNVNGVVKQLPVPRV